jgi:hypothetical protein
MKYYFGINMTSLEFLPYYQGRIKAIVATSNSGVRVEFPAMHLRNYLTASGIRGQFCLQTRDNKFLSLDKIA